MSKSVTTVSSNQLDAMRMVSFSEAAELLNVDVRTIARRVKAGRYIAYGEGTGKKILLSSILADIERTTGVKL